MTTPFETLKREATHLERQLEEKIGRYQQLTQNLSTGNNNGSSNGSTSDYMSRVEQGLQETDVTTQQQDIQFLFNQLSELINKRLKAVIVTPSQRATSQRYQDILQDLRADYEKSNQILRRVKERHELMAGAAPLSNGSSNDAAMDSLLRERNHIQNSMTAAANVIGQAENVRQDLYWQGRTLRSTSTVMSQITNNIPGVNTLIEQIRRRRSQDDRVVASVIAFCIAFTLWYLFG